MRNTYYIESRVPGDGQWVLEVCGEGPGADEEKARTAKFKPGIEIRIVRCTHQEMLERARLSRSESPQPQPPNNSKFFLAATGISILLGLLTWLLPMILNSRP